MAISVLELLPSSAAFSVDRLFGDGSLQLFLPGCAVDLQVPSTMCLEATWASSPSQGGFAVDQDHFSRDVLPSDRTHASSRRLLHAQAWRVDCDELVVQDERGAQDGLLALDEGGERD